MGALEEGAEMKSGYYWDTEYNQLLYVDAEDDMVFQVAQGPYLGRMKGRSLRLVLLEDEPQYEILNGKPVADDAVYY